MVLAFVLHKSSSLWIITAWLLNQERSLYPRKSIEASLFWEKIAARICIRGWMGCFGGQVGLGFEIMSIWRSLYANTLQDGCYNKTVMLVHDASGFTDFAVVCYDLTNIQTNSSLLSTVLWPGLGVQWEVTDTFFGGSWEVGPESATLWRVTAMSNRGGCVDILIDIRTNECDNSNSCSCEQEERIEMFFYSLQMIDPEMMVLSVVLVVLVLWLEALQLPIENRLRLDRPYAWHSGH